MVEFYVRAAGDSKTVYPLGSTYLGDKDREYARTSFLSCRVCRQPTTDLPAFQRPPAGWPDVLFVVCDQGRHRVEQG